MSTSLVIDWLNENALRAFPLKEMITRTSDNTYVLTDSVILDAQFVYASVPNSVQLLSIVSDSSNVTFTCTGGVSFVASKSAEFPLSIRTNQGHLLTVGSATASIPNGTYNFSNVVFEPSVSYEFGGEWLGVSSLAFDSSSTLTGHLNFIEGYQFQINIASPVLTLGCGAGFGTPISCNSFSGLTADCDSIISYINGVGPDGNSVLHFSEGGGVVILEDPDNHRIFIGLTNDPTIDVCKDIPINPEV